MSSPRLEHAPADTARVLHKHDAARAVARLGIGSSHAVLDLGCGDGYHSRLVGSGPFGRIVDLDLNLAGLRGILRESSVAPGGRLFVCADALTLPFAAETFDRVICSLVFYLLPIRKALGELNRIMKPEAKAYIRVPMLSPVRAWKAFTAPVGMRERLYSVAHVACGVLYAVLGQQVRNGLLRHDQWACYLPRSRFIHAVRQAGFRMDCLEVDYPRPGVSSIDAWISRT
jgi:SAM-dependent methyltransferase